jgi:DNA (cytosine-5)-methyltransferase 1
VSAPLTVGSLFSGIGGLELGLEWAGLGPTLWQVERDRHCRHWLAQHWPDAERHDDVCAVGAHNLTPVDVLAGGFPCQPHSVAGNRKGSEDDRDLWGEFARLIRELRPRYVVAENVPGLLTSDGGQFFNRVLSDLAALRYDAEWDVLSAAQFGAPHLRERLFVIAWNVAHADGGRCEQRHAQLRECRAPGSRHVPVEHAAGARRARGEVAGDCGSDAGAWGRRRVEPERAGAVVGDTSRDGRASGLAGSHARHEGGAGAVADARHALGWSDAVPVRGYDGTVRLIPREAAEAGPESPLWPVADGVPGRVARLRAVGNAVVPAVGEYLGRLIVAADAAREVAA